jgi:sulfatase maturation enzyme AslB (radical SAM superfamily)
MGEFSGKEMKQKIVVNSLALNISIRCNMKCSRCYQHLDAFSAPYFMDFDTARRSAELVLSQLPPGGGDIMFFGGEPLLNWALMQEFILWWSGLGTPENVRLLTITNGLALSKEKIDFLARHDISPITLSLDGDYATHSQTRPISQIQYDHIISMMQYGLAFDPLFVIPYCVLRKENIPAAYDILSYIASLGARTIDLGRDLFENWTDQDRAEVVKQANAVTARYGVIVQPFTESIFDCVTCYAPSIMIYPNGDIYDSCYTVASVLRHQGLITEEDCQVMYMGNVHAVDGFYVDLEKKRELIRPLIYCPVVHDDIFVAMDRLQEGTSTEHQPRFRVMEVLGGKAPPQRRLPEGLLGWLQAVRSRFR